MSRAESSLGGQAGSPTPTPRIELNRNIRGLYITPGGWGKRGWRVFCFEHLGIT
jgi:hypothetical protein